MKKTLLTICITLAMSLNAEAHLQPPITRYLQTSTTVCIAKATEVTNGVVTFSVSEIIKGTPLAVLKLRVAEVPVKITLNSEWLLAYTGSTENSVGWAIKGDHGWVNAPIKRVDGKIYLVGNYGYIDKSLAADYSKCLTLDHLKELAVTPIPKD